MTADAPKFFPGSQNGRTQRWIWVAVMAVIIFTGAIRLRLAEVPLERDEGEYAYTGQLMLQGVPPYKGSYFMKLPGTHAMYALNMAIFGQTRAGVHRGLLAVNAASIVLIFLLGRKLSDPIGGLVTCATFGIMSLSPCVFGPVAHATQFVVLFGLAGTLVTCKAIESGRLIIYFLSGCLMGLAVLMKQPGAFFSVFGGLVIIWSERWARPIQWPRFFKRGALYACGVVLPFALTCLILWRVGVFERFWFWTVTCVRAYGTALPLRAGWSNLKDYFSLNLDPSMVLWFLAIPATVCIIRDRAAGAGRIVIPMLLILSAAAVSQGMYYRPHYFIMLIPALALALGAGASSLRRLILKTRPTGNLTAMPAAYVAVALIVVVAGQAKFLFGMTPDEICRRLYYPGEAFVETVKIADYIKSNSIASDRIAVIGSEPQICFDSHRRSATGYIYTYTFMEPRSDAKQMQEDMIAQIEEARPELLVYVDMPNSWDRVSGSDTTILKWCTKYRRDFYQLVGKVNFPPDKPSKFYWENEIALAPAAEECIYVYKRNRAAPH